MIVTLAREWYEKCRVWVLGTTFFLKDYNKSVKEKVFESKEKAVAEAEKFISRRLKTGSWKVLGETLEDYYLHKVQWLEARVKEEAKLPGYDEIKCQVTGSHPAEFSDLDKLAQTVGCSLDEIPRDYQNFLLTVNGFEITYHVERNRWGSGFVMSFVATYTQQWFREHKAEFPCLEQIQEPFVVVSNLNRSQEKKSLTGAVLFLSSGALFNYDEDTKIGEFKGFRDYFEFESLEFRQRCHDARYWVDHKAG